jgi:hypothetical protein
MAVLRLKSGVSADRTTMINLTKLIIYHIMKINQTATTVGAAVCAYLLTSYGAHAQNLFATYNDNLYQITPSGAVTTFAPLTAGDGLTFGPNGNLFVAQESGNGNILEFTPGGAQSTFTSQAGTPTFLAFNGAGNLFESDHNGNIFEYSSKGSQTTFATGMDEPQGLAFNSAGDLFVAGGNQSPYIYEYTPAGVQSTFTTQVNNPIGIAFNSAGNLFEADANSGNIYEFTPAGVRSTFASGLSNLQGLAFNQTGDLFVGTGDSIDEFTPNGTKSTFTSATGGAGLAFEPVPEPSAYALVGLGLAALIIRFRKNAKTARA